MRFAIYSRKSKYTGKGDSVENQVEMCKNYISTHYPNEDNVIDVYEDEGFSGKNLNRPQFKKFTQEQNKHPYDFLVVYRLDRVSRNVGDFSFLIDELNRKKTSFITIKEQFDTSTPMGRAMMNIASVFAQLERETIAERIKDNMYLLAKNGKWTGGTTPLGYKSIKITNGDKSYYVLDFDYSQIQMVKLIFKKYRETQSIRGTETYLRDSGYKTQKGNEWESSNLKRVLTNPIYCIADDDSLKYFTELGCNVCFNSSDCDGKKGIMPYNRFAGQKRELTSYDQWIITVSKHKGILTGKEWIEIQDILRKNSKNKFGGVSENRRNVNPKSILSGVLFCSCGAYMRPKIYASGNMYYICERKMETKKQECQMPNINGDDLDRLVLDEILNYDIEDSSISKQLLLLKNKINNVGNEIDEHIKKLEKKKKDNQEDIDAFKMAITLALKSKRLSVVESYEESIEKLINDNNCIDKQIAELFDKDCVKTEMTNYLNTIQEAMAYLKNNFGKLSVQNRREFVKKIVEKIIWNGKEIHIFIKGVSE